MAVEINNNPSGGTGDNGGGAMTAMVAILVIVIIALAVWFGFRHWGGSTGSTGGTNINVSLPNTNGGGGTQSGTGY